MLRSGLGFEWSAIRHHKIRNRTYFTRSELSVEDGTFEARIVLPVRRRASPTGICSAFRNVDDRALLRLPASPRRNQLAIIGRFLASMAKFKTYSYAAAGVSIDEADQAVNAIKRLARRTFTKGVLTEIGSFGACFELPKMRKPVLISSVDGVGTKLKVAFLTGKHDSIGEDLVNHCVNDIAVQGAQPLYFLDYFSVGKLDAKVAAAVVSGIARGCKANGCALIGGETAEMPGLYREGEYDLAGTVVGVAEKRKLITGASVRKGDVLIGLPSTGLHTNGYSLARKLLFEVAALRPDSYVEELGRTVGEELLAIHRSYLKPVRALHRAGLLRAAAHITGGGITDNTPRILPKGLAARIDGNAWKVPPIFELLRRHGSLSLDDWRRTFNLGIGMILVVSEKDASRAEKMLRKSNEQPLRLGEVIERKRGRPRLEFS